VHLDRSAAYRVFFEREAMASGRSDVFEDDAVPPRQPQGPPVSGSRTMRAFMIVLPVRGALQTS